MLEAADAAALRAFVRDEPARRPVARIYRALVVGIDGAYEPYERVLRSALAAYVDCLSALGPGSAAWDSGVSLLSELVDTRVEWYRVFDAAALVVLFERE